ncbi:FimV/HubP family polar landmark protein [Simplicispira psychrophila]|uniref:FimV/HubP family polar landmark protein n=1 Tax=Simplicispira psychrophila TaxID=80882 RepID=UPI000482390F|nr:FimV/HubP family polar landmark protein [Simplicispira psychrophila]
MHCWKYSALAMAAAVSVGLYAPDAAALALGPITVQSALGEPLRAEIDLPQITAAEADSLQASTASAEAFRAQGMEYSSIANQVQMKLHRRPDGRSVLRLSGSTPVNDPFVDLVVDARWSSGHITRSYTMLFDPPSLRRTPATVTAAAQISAPAPSAAPAPRPAPAPAPAPSAPSATRPPASVPPEPRASAPSRAPRPTPAPAPRLPTSTSEGAAVTVKPGDTAGRIATAHRPGSVSLDQMLVALMRSNPDAFIQGNVNRIKAGAVLQMPSSSDALATPTGEARQIIALQSRDFNEFRRKLARVAPATQQAAAERSAKGSVQTQTDDKRAAATAPDKLTLSKGALQGKKSTEELLAQRKQANEASARTQELAKNIEELNKLSTASAPAGATPAPGAKAADTGSSAAPGITLPVPSPVTVTPPVAATTAAPAAATPAAPATVVAPADKPAPASTEPAAVAEVATPEAAEADAPATPAAAPPAVVAIAPPPATPAPEPAPAPSFLSELMEDPMVPFAGAGLLALLLGYGGYRVLQRRRDKAPLDSSFMDSRVQPDSFFGGSGGQRVDTAGNDTTTGGSSLAFTSSQLDAGGDVDPVAEADVYLAYGRDLQAEEILKEAVRHNPERISVYVKLAEIYAKRQDRKALEATAQDVHKRTQGSGPEWTRVSDLGREIDPANALYQIGGLAATASVASDAASIPDFGLARALAEQDHSDDYDDLSLDLDLESLNDALSNAPASEPISFAEAAKAAGATTDPVFGRAIAQADDADETADPAYDLDLPALDFGSAPQEPSWDAPAPPPPAPPVPKAAPKPEDEPSMTDLDFSIDMPDLDLPDISPKAAAAVPPPEDPFTLPDSGMMEFSLDDLSLDLDTPQSAATANPVADNTVPPPLSDDPLATKLALAQEFNTIGDSDGARTLIEEVIAESSGELKARAERLLSELD